MVDISQPHNTAWNVSVFGVILVQIRENTEQNKYQYKCFSRREICNAFSKSSAESNKRKYEKLIKYMLILDVRSDCNAGRGHYIDITSLQHYYDHP